MDAVDAALLGFEGRRPSLHATHAAPLPAELRTALRELALGEATDLDTLGSLDQQVARCFAEAALAVLAQAGVAPGDIRAIGSHGQTVRHRPGGPWPFTLQIGDPATIAEITGITTVADFRRGDMAAGGQGAPLVPPFHAWLLADHAGRHAVLNLGGIANLSLVENGILRGGFDTGPACTLLDAWARRHLARACDHDGTWAGEGRVVPELLARLLEEPYLALPPPKSTGLELFNLAWLDAMLERMATVPPADVMSTLAEFTAHSVVTALERWFPGCVRVWLCGGGARNRDLVRRLTGLRPALGWETTEPLGLAPDWVEAAAFAWLAERRLAGLPGNAPVVTGARHEVLLGGVYC
ncbi:MAG: anhydro-N-acetylmuramic acid kinase [Gammaproteobacteria bacterium]|nr:anhydro-N-acetylmuramic acid kinase [Gammaproteobacteria bacterium]TVQ44008.1 MAG: anhydro-N-acetylmuramic acid kinase [Gammaproteobacteria bacterium]